MTHPRARRVLFVLGLAFGGLLAFGTVAAVLLALAQNSGAGHVSRHGLAAGLAGVRSGAATDD